MDVFIEELKFNEIKIFTELVNSVFDEFVGKDYSEEGKSSFKEYIENKNNLKEFNKNEKIYVAKYKEEIIGILEIRNNDHISLFFVKKEYHNKGIGKILFEYFKNKIKQEKIGINIISVNSSIYAEKIYKKLGFVKTDELQEKNGIKYIPMKYVLNMEEI